MAVRATDPLTAHGLASSLGARPEVVLAPGPADVVVVATDQVSAETVALLRATAAEYGSPQVLVTGSLNPTDLLTIVECRVAVVLPRATATGDRLVGAIEDAAAGRGALPSDLLGDMLRQVGALQREVLAPHGLSPSGLAARELDVLRLLADGCDTLEVAVRLSYSERTVKNIVHTMITRLNLRNRSHAVAYAIRTGAI